MKITMPRGDRVEKSFAIRQSDGTAFTETLDEIYFTVKKNFHDKNYKFQKRLTDDGIVFVEAGRYQFTILPEDTDGLDFGNYVFDIELVIDGRMKRTFTGTLILTEESTHAANEVISG